MKCWCLDHLRRLQVRPHNGRLGHQEAPDITVYGLATNVATLLANFYRGRVTVDRFGVVCTLNIQRIMSNETA